MSSILQLLEQPSASTIVLTISLLLMPVILIRRLSKTRNSCPQSINLPPSPPKLPILGNLHQFGSHPHRSLQSLSIKHGPIMQLFLGNSPAVIISSAEGAREIMKTHDLIFANRPDTKASRKLLYNLKDVSTASYGETWRQLKSVSVLQLLSNKRVQSYRMVREEETRKMLKKIEDISPDSVVNLSEMFMEITNDVVSRAAFGRKYGEDEKGKRFKYLLRELLGLLGAANIEDVLPWLSWINKINGRDVKVDGVAKGIDEFLEEVVEERLHRIRIERSSSGKCFEVEKTEDFIDILLRIHLENEIGVQIDRDSVKALILDIFVAGTDTTASVLEWAMTELLRHPRIMKRLQDEVRGIALGIQGVNEDDLEKMVYLKAIIKETLRYHTPIPLLIPRKASQDAKVMGYEIKSGTMVIINAWAIGRDPKSWDDPEEFKPERFLESPIDFKGHNYEFIPFGAGRRGCPGIAFAMVTNELVLANLVNKFDWALPNGAKGQDLDTKESAGLTVHREIPLLAVATPST